MNDNARNEISSHEDEDNLIVGFRLPRRRSITQQELEQTRLWSPNFTMLLTLQYLLIPKGEEHLYIGTSTK